MTKRLQVLSLGAGVQSSTLLLLSIAGELPKLDAAVFADTQWEPKRVYEYLGWLAAKAVVAGIPILTVTAGNLRKDSLRASGEGKRAASVPLFLSGGGVIRRQCTSAYKIEPVDLKLSEMIGRKSGERWPKEVVVDLWFGISTDETRRARQSTVLWKRKVFPLLNLPDKMLSHPMSRADCLLWLKAHYPEIEPPRSACIGCPYHSNTEWRRLRRESAAEFADAVEFDASIRSYQKLDQAAFLHRSLVPLSEVDFSTVEERGQGNFLDECEGMCGV